MITKAKLTKSQLNAIQDVGRGNATADQQKLAIQAIVVELCKTNLSSFSPENNTLTAYREGERSVGISIREIVAGLNGHIEIIDVKGDD